MNTYNYDYDIAAILLYIIILLVYYRSKHLKNTKFRIFTWLVICSVLTPVFDILGGLAIEMQLTPALVQIPNILYYTSELGNAFCLFLFAFVQFEMRNSMSLKRKAFMLAPVLIAVTIIALNPLHGWMFTYQDGVFTTGWLRLYIFLVPLFYFIWAVTYCTRHRNLMNRNMRYIIYCIAVINFIPRAIHLIKPDLLVHSFAISISVLLLFLHTLKTETVIDRATGLANRAYLAESVQKMMFNKYEFTSIMVRIADYDLLTTSYGIRNTEQFMVEIAKFLQSFVDIGNAFQVSNSCFVVNLVNGENVEDMTNNIYDGLNRVWSVSGLEMVASCFVTSVTYPTNCPNQESFRAYLTYFQKMHRMRYGIVPTAELGIKDKIRENQVELAIERAIAGRSFEVYFQPICTNFDKRFMTAEALIRLTDEDLGPISPAEFIPLSESNGTIIQIGNFVLEKVCEFISSHDMEALGLHYIEMNLSTLQCLQRNFIDTVDEITSRYHVDSQFICFEITETASNCAPAIFSENLQLLKRRGYKLALDDFGTGYANVQRMITSEFDLIKFDRVMTQRTCADPKLPDVFTKMLAMFHSMGAEVVAEGVETKEQFDFLKSAGNDYIQGFYFSPAITAEEFVEFLQHNMSED